MANQRVLTDLDFSNSAGIVNLPNGVNPGDAVNFAQLQAAIQSIVIAFKDEVRVASTGNVDIANPPATIDGVTLAAGDRILLKDQTSALQNGIYVYNGSATPLTRATDADDFDELEVAVVPISEGTANSQTFWRQTQVNGTIDVDDVLFTSFLSAVPPASETVAGVIEIATQAEVDAGTATNLAVTPATLANWAGRKLKLCQDIGDGTNTVYNITHNFGTRDVHIETYALTGSFDTIIVGTERPDDNTVRLCFDTPPPTNSFRVCVIG